MAVTSSGGWFAVPAGCWMITQSSMNVGAAGGVTVGVLSRTARMSWQSISMPLSGDRSVGWSLRGTFWSSNWVWAIAFVPANIGTAFLSIVVASPADALWTLIA